jgi:hypothetical protein
MPTVNNRGRFSWSSAFGSSPGGATESAVAAGSHRALSFLGRVSDLQGAQGLPLERRLMENLQCVNARNAAGHSPEGDHDVR